MVGCLAQRNNRTFKFPPSIITSPPPPLLSVLWLSFVHPLSHAPPLPWTQSPNPSQFTLRPLGTGVHSLRRPILYVCVCVLLTPSTTSFLSLCQARWDVAAWDKDAILLWIDYTRYLLAAFRCCDAENLIKPGIFRERVLKNTKNKWPFPTLVCFSPSHTISLKPIARYRYYFSISMILRFP